MFGLAKRARTVLGKFLEEERHILTDNFEIDRASSYDSFLIYRQLSEVRLKGIKRGQEPL